MTVLCPFRPLQVLVNGTSTPPNEAAWRAIVNQLSEDERFAQDARLLVRKYCTWLKWSQTDTHYRHVKILIENMDTAGVAEYEIVTR